MNEESREQASAAADVDDRRRSERQAHQAGLTLRLTTDSIRGITDNLSQIGVLFFSQEPLRVEVEVVDGDGETHVRTGRLVRVQRMSEANTGFAVEFDRD